MTRRIQRRLPLLALAALLVLVLGSTGLAQTGSGKKEKVKPGAGGALLAQDRGRLRVLLDGQPAGTEDFQISASGAEWVARGTAEITPPGGATTVVNAKLRLGPDATPIDYEWSTEGAKKASAVISFQGGTAKMELRMEGAAPFTQDFFFESPRVVILDNNLYHHYAILARLYDWKAKGAQTFPVLIPQDLTPGTITVELAGTNEVEGVKVDVLLVRSADLQIELYVDADRRLVRLAVPDSKAEVIREHRQ